MAEDKEVEQYVESSDEESGNPNNKYIKKFLTKRRAARNYVREKKNGNNHNKHRDGV